MKIRRKTKEAIQTYLVTVEWGYRVASSVYIFSVYFKLRNLYEIKSDLTSFKHSIIQQKVVMWQ